MRLVAALAPPPDFGQVFELYRASGFLYPGKLRALEPRLPAIEDTWKRALDPGCGAFRVHARLGLVEGGICLRSAISAFAYAGSSWHGQHLVSRDRHEYTGTIAVLIALVEGLHDEGVAHIRLTFRPENRGTNRLFGDVAVRLAPELRSFELVDYGLAGVKRLRLASADVNPSEVRRLGPEEGVGVSEFYSRILHPVELASLGLDDPCLRGVDAGYAAAGLRRRRTVLVAVEAGEIVGACLVHDSSLGLNFSFLENAIEHLRVRPDLDAARRRATWLALARAAVADLAGRSDHVVAALSPADRDLSVAAGLVTDQPKQYAMLTVARRRDGYLQSMECFLEHYRRLMSSEGQR